MSPRKIAARVKGGLACQARKDPARRRGARLLLIMAPPGGWSSPAEAARAIEPHLVKFIKDRHISLVCEGSLRRTIVRWIKKHPVVRAAFDKCRAPWKLPW